MKVTPEEADAFRDRVKKQNKAIANTIVFNVDEIIEGMKMWTHWRPSAHAKRHCTKLDRYYAKCQVVANGHHSTPPHEKRYNWLVKHDHGVRDVAQLG